MMFLKPIGKFLMGFVAILVVYLSLVGIWATLVVDALLPDVEDQHLLSTQQQAMLLKIEDPTFYKHIGIDVSQGQGLTTITSSLARQIFLFGDNLSGVKGGFQSFYRSVFECCKKLDIGRDVMAVVLNQKVSKDRQLQLFVATTYMGRYRQQQVIGFSNAANSYFNKTLAELSDDEFISLVARLKAPNHYHPTKGPKQLEDRVDKIKQILAGQCKPDGWFDTKYAHCAAKA